MQTAILTKISPAKIPVRKYRLRDNAFIVYNGVPQLRPYHIPSIKDLDNKDKPRERLMAQGPSVLSEAELLSIILNTGTKKEGVLEMTTRILKEYGEKNISNQKNPRQLIDDLQVPQTKACQIVAVFELGRRFFEEKNEKRIIIKNAQQAYQYLYNMRNLPKEQLRGLYLNSQFRVIHDEVIAVGGLNVNIINPREVFSPALSNMAAAVVIAHNHPSGSARATKSDITTTKRLIEAGKIVGVDLIDHLVIGQNGFTSVPADYPNNNMLN